MPAEHPGGAVVKSFCDQKYSFLFADKLPSSCRLVSVSVSLGS